MKKKDLRVVELFAGVGGFRIGLEGYGKKKLNGYKTLWWNQWEPGTTKQHAAEVYAKRFGYETENLEEKFYNKDISKVPTTKIPDHDLLVGGFPCQDYSVARTLSQAAGLTGKKGVLWWEIFRILKEKGKNAPKFLFLENVDRLLRSPANARGRDFAIMLASLAELGYLVEWRVINAAEYGKPQRRKRTFILGYKKSTGIGKEMLAHLNEPLTWMLRDGVIATGFPVEKKVDIGDEHIYYDIGRDAAQVSTRFKELCQKHEANELLFFNAGMMIDGHVYTIKTKEVHTPKKGEKSTLGSILQDEKEVDPEYYVPKEQLGDKKTRGSWAYLKGEKDEIRKAGTGHQFHYKEGSMAFPDELGRASRTIITAEGGSSPSRFKHIIRITDRGGKWKNGVVIDGVRYTHRRLTPIELERLCQFPDNHTAGVPDTKRAFFMGNALVVGVIKDMGRALLKKIEEFGD